MNRELHNLREYEIFSKIFETGSLTLAAKQLNISQPAISQGLASLENRLSCKLFDRDNNKLHPTSSAFELNSHLQGLFRAISNIERNSSVSTSESTDSKLDIATTMAFADHFILPVIHTFQTQNPETTVSLESLNTMSVIKLISEGTAQLALVFGHGLISRSTSIKFEPFVQSISCCIVPRGHPLQSHNSVTATDLSGLPQIGLNRRFAFRTDLENIFEEAGAYYNIVAEGGSVNTVAELIKGGLGIGVLNPFPSMEHLGDSFIAIPFEPVIIRHSYFIYSRQHPLSPIARRFIDHARSCVRETQYFKIAHDDSTFFDNHLNI